MGYCSIISGFKNHFVPSGIYGYSRTVFPIFFIALILGIFSITQIHFNNHVKAQSSQVFRVTVEVTNNGITDEYGTIYVKINDTQAIDGLGGKLFPAGETVSFELMYSTKESSIGKGFVA
jgi:hypothetical protein